MIERIQDGLRRELKQMLIALQFRMMRDLTEIVQALEACIIKGQQSRPGGGKRKEIGYFIVKPSRPYLF